MSKQTYRLAHDTARLLAVRAVQLADEGDIVTIAKPKRSSEQNAKFHAICSDIAKSEHMFAGKPRNADAWKVLLVSGHAQATKEGSEIVPGIEGEFVNIRESTASMTVKRGASLIEYALAYCAMNGVKNEAIK